MGLILDTSVLIAHDRRRGSVEGLLSHVRRTCGETELGTSTVSVVELTHGIYRAKTSLDRDQRALFAATAFRALVAYPLTIEIAELAGRIDGEQAANGVNIAFEDLIIGATALQLGFAVATFNVKHFQQIPNLEIVVP